MGVPEILLFCDYYLPGFKAGGGLRTAVNLVEQLGDEFHFRVVTRDRDLGDTTPYAGCEDLRWRRVGPADVLYLPPRLITSRCLRRLLCDVPHDVRMFNSLFSTLTVRSLTLARCGCVPARATIVAPRGELSPGALAQKRWKKRGFLAAARCLNLYRDVTFLATNPIEAAEVREHLSPAARVSIAPDLLSRPPQDAALAPRAPKQSGRLRIVFLSRISPKKNLEYALRTAGELQGEIEFDIIGPQEDSAYWARCQALIAALPPHVRVTWRGTLPPEQIPAALAAADVLLLPTLGENFGYVILEALQAGCAVVVSDRTPWRGLAEAGVGHDLPLEHPEQFRAALQHYLALGPDAFAAIARRARDYADHFCRTSPALRQNREILWQAAGGNLAAPDAEQLEAA